MSEHYYTCPHGRGWGACGECRDEEGRCINCGSKRVQWIEHVWLTIPAEADRRASGSIMKEAARRGWIRSDGFAPAASSNGSAKTRWRSLIYGGAA